MKKLISKLSALVVPAVKKYTRRVRKVRWVYLALLPLIIGVLVLIFEWDFVKHLGSAMVVEALLHHCVEAAVKVEESA